LVGNEERQLLAARLRLTNKANRGLSVTTRRIEHEVKILLRVRVADDLLKHGDDGREDRIDQDDQAAPKSLFVLPD
jgi:hypothetical protein